MSALDSSARAIVVLVAERTSSDDHDTAERERENLGLSERAIGLITDGAQRVQERLAIHVIHVRRTGSACVVHDDPL